MSFNLPGEMNPFEAPRAGIGEEAIYRDIADQDAELIRREHLGRESNIKSVGCLYYIATLFGGLFTIFAALMAAGIMPPPQNQAQGTDPSTMRIIMGAAAAFYLVVSVVNGALGYGLRHFQVWARWTAVVLVALALLGIGFYAVIIGAMINPIGGIGFFALAGGFAALVLFLLLSGKARVVFSSEYREIIRKTPDVKLKTSVLVMALAIIIVSAIVIAVLYGIFNSGNR